MPFVRRMFTKWLSFSLSAVRSVQSCSSTYKYSVRLQRYNSPRGLYLEARYNGFSGWTREKSIIAPSVKKYRVYIPIGG